MHQVLIYTDGACSSNPGPGGWAALLRCGTYERELSGGEAQTTNNRMELSAAIEALRALKKPCEVTVHSDSQYVVRGMNEWISGWQAKGWKKVANADLWQTLLEVSRQHQIKWVWVRGHAGHPENERVDRLAVRARDQAASGAGQR